MIQGVDHIAVAVSNIAQSADFYIAMLNMRPADSRSPYETEFYWLSFGMYQSLNLCLNPEQTPNALGVELDWDRTPHMALTTSEKTISTVEKQLTSLEMPCKREPTSLYFCDPDGNFLELTCWREARLQASGGNHW